MSPSAPHQRDIFLLKIKWNLPPRSLRISSPQDYIIKETETLNANTLASLSFLPYCFDPTTERMVFTVAAAENTAAIFAAPFLFMGQRLHSKQLLAIPFERLAGLLDDKELSPTFIFSPGRTGSTLLSRLLTAAGTESISEPDLLTQLAFLTSEDNATMPAARRRLLVKTCVAALAKHSTKSAFIKLRSQCTSQANLFAAALPKSRIVFMFRGKDDWAISRHSHFKSKPEDLAKMLASNIFALNKLQKAGYAPHVVIYEKLVTDTFAQLALLSPGIDVTSPALREAVEKVLATDSQEGSSLKRNSVDLNASQEFIDEFQKAWDAAKPSDLIQHYGLSECLG